MATPIRMPDLGTTTEEFPFMAWLVEEGESVTLGDPLAEIETDKAVTLLESPAKGVLLQQVACAGDIVRAGEIVAYVGAPGEVIAAGETATRAPVAAAPPTAAAVVSDSPLPVAPIVRNLAAHLGVDLAAVRGSGRNGVITREDVLRAGQGTPATPPAAPAPGGARLSRGQLAVARHVVRSWTETPHLYMSASVEMSAAQGVRERSRRAGVKISYDALILRAMATAIREMPLLASRLDGEQIIPAAGGHLALAVGIDNDLFLPVIRDVEGKSLAALQQEIASVVAQVRAKTLAADHQGGGCMALSNLGMYPIDDFDPIIFPGHSAILAVGAIQPTPVAVNGCIGIRPIMKMRLAVDHRLINGRTAAEFISKVKAELERDADVQH